MEKTAEQIALEKLRERLTKRLNKACADYGLLADGDKVLIGLSGGKDSLALTELLGRRAQIYKPRFEVMAVHVRVKERNYQTDLSYLEHFCQEAGVPLIVRDTMINDEMSARHASSMSAAKPLHDANPCFLCSWYRRKMLFQVAQEMGCNKIAFGHHKDDIVQTLLMNLVFAGSFATMPPLLQLEKMPLQIIRPLCLIEEADLTEYATMRGYQKQQKLCPYEHESARTQAKTLLEQMKAMNPEALSTLYNSMTNIKAEYLPLIVES